MKTVLIFGGLLLWTLSLWGQSTPFNVVIEPMNITNLGGLQSYAVAQHDGKWLIVGGRLDGLHQRQPFAAFGASGNNNQIIVVDPVAEQKWSASLSALPTGMQEQLSSTNMEFYQEGDYLYCLGGYGYSATLGDHTTYDKLTAIKVSAVIDSVISGGTFDNYFRQITDTLFQVTGGRLRKIEDNFYLVGGQKFLGRYNPRGPSHGPGFTQKYTDAIRVFSIADNDTTITITHLPSYLDSVNLHRRDYNAEPQIMPNGEQGITAFSGVFQHGIDLPFLNCVNIDTGGYVVNNSFQQHYNHYHCGVVPVYSASANEMHTVFFGGIAQYYDSLGTLVQDNNVPFVKTIARVTRDSAGNMAEYKLPVEMPILLGAGAEFIPIKSIPHYSNEVLMLDSIKAMAADSVLVGYIYGGISSTAANIFFTNTGTQSTASSQIFKVYLTKNVLGVHRLNDQSKGSLKVLVFPNPVGKDFVVKFNLIKDSDVKLTLTDINGRVIENTILKNQIMGENIYKKEMKAKTNGIYFLTIETDYEIATRKIIVKH